MSVKTDLDLLCGVENASINKNLLYFDGIKSYINEYGIALYGDELIHNATFVGIISKKIYGIINDKNCKITGLHLYKKPQCHSYNIYNNSYIQKISDYVSNQVASIFILHIKAYINNGRDIVIYMRLLFNLEEISDIFKINDVKLTENHLFDITESEYYRDFPNLGKCYDLYKIYNDIRPNILQKPENDIDLDDCLNKFNNDIRNIYKKMKDRNTKIEEENIKLKKENLENLEIRKKYEEITKIFKNIIGKD